MSDVVILEIPNVFAEFSRVSRVCRNDVWFLYLVLKSFSVSPTYILEVLLSMCVVTMAW